VDVRKEAGRANKKQNTYLLFVRLCAILLLAVFNRCAMRGFASDVLSCQERERLEGEFFEARTRGRNLSRLRHLTYRERAALDEREEAARARLAEHEVAHGCGR
jgi:hypothetical protein